MGGNPDGDITVVEFIDYRCGYCRKAYQEVEDLVKADGNIRLVLKEYPILGEDSTISSRFAIAVLQLHGGEAYKKAHDALITCAIWLEVERDVALCRGHRERCPVVLGSATPCLESLHLVEEGKLLSLRLTQRAGNAAPERGLPHGGAAA